MLRRIKKIGHRLVHWEYWNTWLIYLPLSPFWLYFSIKNRSLYFFEKANPGIQFGGMAMTAKSEIYALLPEYSIPKTRFLSALSTQYKTISDLQFPLMAKPNFGLKGLGVSQINNLAELKDYRTKYPIDIIIQEKIPFNNEVGLFYVRLPHQKKGQITGMVKKNFLSVVGDGQSTLKELILATPRTAFQYERLKSLWQNDMHQVIPKDKCFQLLAIGSHTRGAEFVDFSHELSEPLLKKIDSISQGIPGFFYGRFDVMYENIVELKKGHFVIIELNGAMSEPTHMYDPKYSIWQAWSIILKHWSLLSEISRQNKSVTCYRESFIGGLKRIWASLQLEKQLKVQLLE